VFDGPTVLDESSDSPRHWLAKDAMTDDKATTNRMGHCLFRLAGRLAQQVRLRTGPVWHPQQLL